MKDVIIIPTYNERENIREILSQVTILYPKIFVWVVDDNSPDGTGSIVRKFSTKNNNVRLFVRKEKTGLGDAYKYIHKQIQGRNDIRNVVTMDADGSHDPEDIKKMISKLDKFDLVIGSRYTIGGKIEGWDKKRFLLSYFGNIYNRIITGLPVRDGTAGFVAFRSDALRKIDLLSISSEGYSYQIEFKNALIEKGCKYLELPIVFSERQLGKSKMSANIIFEGLLMPWKILIKNKVMKKKRFLQICILVLFLISLFIATYKL